MKIVVLAGGWSPEREVSLLSGRMVANALLSKGHRVLLLDLGEGIEQLPADCEGLFRKDDPYEERAISFQQPDAEAMRAMQRRKGMIGPNVLKLCAMADKVFLALHGSVGENGMLQATLDLHGISYTGSDAVGSMIAMDKDLSKRLLRDAGIPSPVWMLFDPLRTSQAALEARVGFPCVIKPSSCGSSVGISMVNEASELDAALAEAGRWQCKILAERRIIGRELTVGILNGKALPTVEICPKQGFYDYKNKYSGETEEICPARIPSGVNARAVAFSLRGFEALHLRGYARFDFLLDHTEGLWCLEANTLPGMTPSSLFPRAAEAAGISYAELCERILGI